MKTLRIYEVGTDDLPIDGTIAIIFNDQTPEGIITGDVSYLYGDMGDTLEEALSNGGTITTCSSLLEEETFIPITVDNHYLVDNTKWLYYHEWATALDHDRFPFPSEDYFNVAVREKWVVVVSGDTFVSLCDMQEVTTFKEQYVIFRGKKFKTRWVSSGNGWGLFSYEELKNETSD